MTNTFDCLKTLTVGGETVHYFSLPALARKYPGVERLPYSLKILLENLLRREDASFVKADDIKALAGWTPRAPSRRKSRSCPRASCSRTSPACPASSTWRRCATASPRSAAIRRRSTRCSRWSWSSTTRCRSIISAARTRLQLNAELEYHRNRERYVFLRWGQTAFRNFRVVPPETGIVHQVNIEYLARVVCRDAGRRRDARVSRHASSAPTRTRRW